jgi:hypothetical protein
MIAIPHDLEQPFLEMAKRDIVTEQIGADVIQYGFERT